MTRHSAIRDRLKHYRRVAPVVVLRWTPLPWRIKRWIVWALSPRFGLGVHAVIRGEQGRVLMLHSAYSRLWQLPGGGVRYGESLELALRRETWEETGIRVRGARLGALLGDRSGRGLHAVFVVDLAPGPIRLSEEHTGWRYADLNDVPPFYRRCVELATQASRQVALGQVNYDD